MIVLGGLAALLAAVATAGATTPWRSTSWALHCGGSAACERGAGDPATTFGFAKKHLAGASRWLKGLRFRGPLVETRGRDYLARIQGCVDDGGCSCEPPCGCLSYATPPVRCRDSAPDLGSAGEPLDALRPRGVTCENYCEIYGMGDPATLANYATRRLGGEVDSRRLLLKASLFAGRRANLFRLDRPFQFADSSTGRITDLDRAWNDLVATAVHEMFHAIHAAYFERRQAQWISEGTAEAVAKAYLKRSGRDPDIQPPHYDDRTLTELDYDAEHFWWSLGQDLGPRKARDIIGYLHPLFRDPPASGQDRIAWLDERLRDLRPRGEGGFGRYFPTFVARHTLDATACFDDVTELEVGLTRRRERATGQLPALGIRAYKVRVAGPAGIRAGLRIALRRAQGRSDDESSLHLIVDDARYDRPSRGEEKNVFLRSVAPGERQELLVRVVNVEENEPERTAPTGFVLEVELEGVPSCHPDRMALALSDRLPPPPFPPDADDGHLDPGESALRLSGLVDDGGDACAHGIGTLSVGSSVLRGRGVNVDAIAGAEAAQRELQALQAVAAERALTPAERRRRRRAERRLRRIVEAPEGEANATLLHVFSPHTITWQLGVPPGPTGTEHAGLGGWQPNTAAHVYVLLPGQRPEGLRPGRSYPAIAVAPGLDGRTTELPRAPTTPGFYSAWRGRHVRVPLSPAELEACENIRAHAARAAAQAGRPPPTHVCQGGLLFGGTTELLTGSLEGEVEVESITGGVVIGALRLQGTGTLTTRTSELIERNGQVRDARTTESTRRGPITLEGRFRAPADITNGPLGPFGHTVRLPRAGRRR
jgi:hypothetical protein